MTATAVTATTVAVVMTATTIGGQKKAKHKNKSSSRREVKKQSKKSPSSHRSLATESKKKRATGIRRKHQAPAYQNRTLGDRFKQSVTWIVGRDPDEQKYTNKRSSCNKQSKDGIESHGYTGEDEEARKKARKKHKKKKKKKERETHSNVDDSNTDDGGSKHNAKDGSKGCRALVAIEPEGHTADEARRKARKERKKKKKAKKEKNQKTLAIREELVEDWGSVLVSRNKGGVDSDEDVYDRACEDDTSCGTRSQGDDAWGARYDDDS